MASPVASNPCPLRPTAVPPKRKELRGPNSEALSRKAAMVTLRILTPDSCLLTPDHQEMKVHPAILMKTHGGRNHIRRENEIMYQVRSPRSEAEILRHPSREFRLLTPACCLLHVKMKVHPAMLMKTHKRQRYISPKR